MVKTATTHDTTRTSDVPREPKLAPSRHDSNGAEVLDPTPMQPPLGYKRSMSLAEQIRQQVRLAQIDLDDNAIEETEEEADDFVVGDDYEPLSPHENDHIPSVKELKKRAAAINAEIRKRNNEAAIEDYKKKAEGRTPGTAPQADPPEASPPAGPALPSTPRQET